MPTFIDEAGTFGWDASASRSFTLTAIWFETPAFAIACEGVISGVRAALGVPTTFEFHFAEISDAQRISFLNAVSACSFQYVACTLQKWRKNKWLESRMWRKRPYFYQKVVAPVVDRLTEYYLLAEACKQAPLCEPVIFDTHTDKVYRETLRDQFYRPKAPSGRSMVNKVRSHNSANDSLVQLADMVCGAYAHSLVSTPVYINLLKSRKIDHIFIP